MRIIINESQYNYIFGDPLPGRNYFPEIDQAVKNSNPIVYSTCLEEEQKTPMSYNNMLTIMLKEGLIMTYPANTTINYVKKLFRLPAGTIWEQDGCIMALINVSKNLERIDRIIRAIQLCGYYLSAPPLKDLEWFATNAGLMMFQFEPKYDRNMKNEILKGETELLHITPKNNKEKIQSIGLVPGSKNKRFAYPERIYLLKGSIPRFEIEILGRSLATSKANDLFQKIFKYIIIHLDIKKIPEDVKLFEDRNYLPYGLYTIDNIPPTAITKIVDLPIDFNKPQP